MTLRYVGPGGSDANNGTSWATRKLTISGAEATPVVAGDTVYVAPGTYRELLTTSVSGSAGNLITYIADTTGENTDSVGGMVRITGSADDTALTRANCISCGNNFRTFRGFLMDLTSGSTFTGTGTNVIIEDCILQCVSNNAIAFTSTPTGNIIRRSIALAKSQSAAISLQNSATATATGCTVENCILMGYMGIQIIRVAGITINQCLSIGCNYGIRISTALATSATITVNNSILCYNNIGFQGSTLGDIVENFNSVFANGTDRATCNTGANSNTTPAVFDLGLLINGYRIPGVSPRLFDQADFSALSNIAGTSMAATDIYGRTRPATDSKKSWGPLQSEEFSRVTTPTQGSSAAALKLPDAGLTQFIVPVTNVSTTFSVYTYREANYAGTNPQMIIRQPGQSPTTVTDAAAASQYNQLTTTLTPAAVPPYVIIELVSNNTATSGSFATYFDTLVVN